MVPSNLGFFLPLLFLLSYLMVVTSVGAGNNVTVKMIRCRDNERQALINFKEGLLEYGDVVSLWGNEKEDCCHWRGIRCNKRTGHVTVLNIRPNHNFDYSARGKVSPSLLELSHLKYLDISDNHFDSNIPDFFGSLTRLQYLNLSNSFDVGNVPHQLGNLTNLRYLDLRSSYGTTVDNLDWLSHLHFLIYLDLSFIDLSRSSDWLQQISKLPSLTELHLSDCHLPEYPLLPITNSSSSLFPLAVVDLSSNFFTYPSTYNWLFNFSSTLVQIDLSVNNLNGSIPDAFWSMVSLENLFLNNNYFIGDLSASFRNLSRLHTLNLESNNFNGSIPEAFGSIVSLENLSLKYNNLIGDLPESFQNLSRLDTLDLENNNFDGQLNEFLFPLAANQKNSLRVLRLGGNQLGGSLPDFTSFPCLREISIYENKLNGSFPEIFSQVADLLHLDLSSNQIKGPFPNLTLFPSLEVLHLQNNHLEDTVTEAYFSNLTKLYYLDLSSNRLTFKFSSEWVPPFQLNYILLRNCNLGPPFPNWLKSQHSISILDMSHVGISDTIPFWFWDLLPGLELLNISNNQIRGILPDLSRKVGGSVIIDASSNNLKGHIPSFPNDVYQLSLSRNMFTGSISFICTTAYTNLIILDLSDNQLSGEVPDCWMNVDQLSYLNLANNNLSGKLPTSIGLLNPAIMQLRNNSLRGELPSSLKHCSRMEVLDLSKNKLSGEVPTWIGTHLTSLVVFSLRKNKFSGSIPPQICHLRYAQVLDLSQNNISGSIPLCFNNLTSLITTEISELDTSVNYGFTESSSDSGNPGFDISEKHSVNAFVQWKGMESEYKSTLGLLKMIDLSSNKLVGTIPNEFARLEGLISLNLSRNKLSGNIIQNIGQMKMLEILDLSQNQLTGVIPSSLASLTFLDVLDLSNNNLMGKIPLSTQLQSFDALSYAGNDKLCGTPLKVCPGEEPNVLPPTPVGHGNAEHNKVGLYVSVVCGLATGFWGFLCPILLRRTWRHAYFRLLQKIYDWMYLAMALNMARLHMKIQG